MEAGGLCVLSQLLGGKPQNLSSSKAADYIDAAKLGLTFLSSSQSLAITTLVPPSSLHPKLIHRLHFFATKRSTCEQQQLLTFLLRPPPARH